LLHYLDDFFSANTDLHKCAKDMEKIKEVFKALGVPLAEDKTIGPKQVVSYLGIELDSVAMQVRLPEEKLTDLKQKVVLWQDRQVCSKKESLDLSKDCEL